MSIGAVLARVVARIRRRRPARIIYVVGNPFTGESPRQRAHRIAAATSKDPA